MSYSGLGAPLPNSVNFIGGGSLPVVNTTVDPNAWRKTVKDQAIALANAASVAGRPWSPFVTKLVKIYAMALTATPQAILVEIPTEPFYSGGWNSSWPGDLFSKAKSGVAAIRALVERAAAPPPPPPPPTYQIFSGAITPLMTSGSSGAAPPPPPVTVAAMDPATVRGTPEYIAACTRAGAMIDPSTRECVPMPPPPPPSTDPMTSYTSPPPANPYDTTNPYAADIAAVQAANPGMSFAEATRIVTEARSGMMVGPLNLTPASVTPSVGPSTATMLPSTGLLGVSWKIWGLGAVAVVGVYAASRMLKANRRRVRRNRRRR